MRVAHGALVSRTSLVLLSLTLTFVNLAHAQPTAADADVVQLQDGSELRGTVLREEPGQFVVLKLADGRELTLSFGEIKRVLKAPRAPTAPTTTQQTTSQDGSTSVRITEDCAKNPELERCKRETTVSTGPGGIGVGGVYERRVRILEPPSTVISFAIEGGFLYGRSLGDGPEFHLYGGGGAIGAKILTGGGPLPGTGGGSWSGVAIDPRANFHGAGIYIPDLETGAGFTTGGGNLAISYQWLRYGSMDPVDLRQHGIGFHAGYSAGVQFTRVYSGESQPIETQFQHGPQFGMLFPEYNAGTSKLVAGFFNVMILPTGDFLFITIQGGAAF
jgi:hypothetical protein